MLLVGMLFGDHFPFFLFLWGDIVVYETQRFSCETRQNNIFISLGYSLFAMLFHHKMAEYTQQQIP